MSDKRFTHLHTHSHYSLLTALPKINDIIKATKEAGMNSIALTDDGNMYGAIEFYKKCQAAEIKPIIGVDFFIALESRHEKRTGIDNRRYRLVLLAKNKAGYKNLIKLVTAGHLEGFYYKPRIDRELLEKYSEGLIAISPSFSGETTFSIKTHDLENAKKVVDEHKKIFGKDYYLEISHHPEIDGHQKIQEEIKKLAKETNTPLVACQECFYIKPEDRAARNTLMSIQTHGDITDNSRLTDDNEDFSFTTPEQVYEYFKDTPEAIENANKIADECNVELELGEWVFPKIDSQNPDEDLRKLVEKGLQDKNLKKTLEIKERMEYELKVISNKGYSPYFLVVSDLMHYAHENKILTTIRGSVAGSLVTYLAGITNINPLEYNLPFERFLNPDRPSAPDIDMDFADNKRDQVIKYAVDKYGKENVAQIGTFGTMMARGSVRDVARAMGFDYATGDRIAKLIPFGSQGFPMSIEKALEVEPELAKLYKSDKDSKAIIDMAKKIEGCARHISVHAAGVVISPEPLTEYVPLQLDPKGKGVITQYDMHAVDDAGLLKFDFLGIKNLAILRDAIKRVKKIRDINLDINKIPLDDEKTFKMLAKGETMGLFQLNGQGMTQFLKELKPSTIHDINAMIALYRPGPMKNIPEYIARKHRQKPITYYHPKMKKFLDKSFGILVYQDDLLYTALELAGYNWETVDKFRKAVGKKIPAEMARQHKIFVKGCIEHSGMTEKQAEGLWNLFEPFQGYGFNKAHAASYGQVAYQTAYMKANFPVEYMAAVMTADSGDVDKIAEAINECKRLNIPVLPPNINESLGPFTVVDKDGKLSESGEEVRAIRFGLFSIKNFGEGIAKIIITEAQQEGKFKSLSDFLSRINDRNLNKKSLEALIKCGALDMFGDRGVLLGNLDKLLNYNKEMGSAPEGQDSLFTAVQSENVLPEIKMDKVPEASKEDRLSWERELLGLYISGHPLDKYKEKLEKNDYTISRTREKFKEGMMTVVSGIVESVREILTKKGGRMAFVKISDMNDSIEIVAFPEVFQKYGEFLEDSKCIAIKGRVSNRNGEMSIIAEAVKAL